MGWVPAAATATPSCCCCCPRVFHWLFCGSNRHSPPRRELAPPAACMQQNGSSGSNGSDGCGGRERQALSFSPLPAAATTRVRRFIQERQRTLPLPKVMVVFSAAGDADKPSDAMSGSDPTEEGEGVRKPPASPSPKHRAPCKPLRSSLSTKEQQEVGRPLHGKSPLH